jgi:cytidyltransferase-like protein
MNDNDFQFGYVIGRFNPMHLGHHELIDEMIERTDYQVIFIGSANKRRTESDPLSFEERKHIIEIHYPNSTIIGIDDFNDIELWKKVLEENINSEVSKIIQELQTDKKIRINIFSPTRDNDHLLRATWINDDHEMLTFTPTHETSATSLRKIWREGGNISHLVKKDTALFLDNFKHL